MEFIRQLFENKIPLQQTLQGILLVFLFDAREFTLIQQLLQFNVLNES